MKVPFDFSTNLIFDWELSGIHEALIRQEINLTEHAINAAGDENIQLVDVLEVILVGTPRQQRFTGKRIEPIAGDQL